MASNDVYWFRIGEDLTISFNEPDFIDFNWNDYTAYDLGEQMSLRARNVSFEKDGQKDFRSEAEIPTQFIHSKGDAIALSPRGWRPLAFIPNGASVLLDKNAFSTVKNHIDANGNPASYYDYMTISSSTSGTYISGRNLWLSLSYDF